MPAAVVRRRSRRASTHDEAERRRLEILQAAVRVFATDGFVDATIESIAASAGIAKGTVYLYFRSKDELYRAALVGGAKELAELVAARLASARSRRGKVEAFVRARLEYFEGHRDFFRIYVAEFTNVFSRAMRLDPELDRLYYEQARVLEHALLATTRDVGTPVAPAEEAALAVADLTRGIAIRRATGRSRRALDADIEMVTEMAWKGLGGR